MVRYWARTIDFFIFIILFLILENIFFEDISFYQEFSRQVPGFVLNMFLSFLYIFMEALFLSTWGTTFGKALLKVRVRNRDGTKLSYSYAFKRTFHLWILGEGMSIPIVSLIAKYRGYGNLIENFETSWDRDGEHIVTHQIIGTLRVFIILIPIVFFFYISIIWE